MRYIPSTAEERAEMLAAIGRGSIDELFSDIPAEVLERYRPLDLEVGHPCGGLGAVPAARP